MKLHHNHKLVEVDKFNFKKVLFDCQITKMIFQFWNLMKNAGLRDQGQRVVKTTLISLNRTIVKLIEILIEVRNSSLIDLPLKRPKD